mgnify:FL=1
MIYNLFQKFHVKHEGFSSYGPRKSDEGADTDLIYSFCWYYLNTKGICRIRMRVTLHAVLVLQKEKRLKLSYNEL